MSDGTVGKYHRWEDVRATRADETSDERRAAIRAELEAEITAYRLAEVRKDQSLTQTDVAHEMGVSPKRISEIESAELARTEVATIRRYIEALGGHLRLVADFPGHTITIRCAHNGPHPVKDAGRRWRSSVVASDDGLDVSAKP